jgi:hypothetical protein
MAKYYLSKNYREISSAGNKAKTDIEKILSGQGYKNAGLKQTICSDKILGFFLTLAGVLKVFFTISANDVVVVQYPFKKYYSFVCNLIHLKRGKVVTVIHDLGTFRRKKLSADKELKRLNHSDVLIVHNSKMKAWIQQYGFAKPMICLEIFDYLSSSVNSEQHVFDEKCIRIKYAGALSFRKNKFLYSLNDILSKSQLLLYGNGFDKNEIKNTGRITYQGFSPSDQLIENAHANFGLVWDGESISSCSGNFGEYLKINNPHKASLYIRCHCPIIIWKEAALASFVAENNIGLCIQSLRELDTVLSSISPEIYNEMQKNVRMINKRISSGYYITKALHEAAYYLR